MQAAKVAQTIERERFVSISNGTRID